jgi:hypothetical protein
MSNRAYFKRLRLLYVNGLAILIERALDANLLAFMRLGQILPVDIVRFSAGILQHVLIARLDDRPAEDRA